LSRYWKESDGVLAGDFAIEDGKVHRRLSSPQREGILKENMTLQNDPGALRPLESMGCELRIPEPDYYMLIELFPELNSPDGETQTRAWQRFLANPISDPYRVHARRKKSGLDTIVASSTITGGVQ
jgi:hypothetical protein